MRAAVLDQVRPTAAAGIMPVCSGSPPSPFAVGVVDLNGSASEELETLSEDRGVRYLQLGGGRCHFRHVALHTDRMQLSFERWSLGMMKIGRPPAGAVTFLVPASASASCRMHGRPVATGEVVMLSDGDELDYRSSGPSALLSVSLDREALESHVRVLFGRHLGELRLQGRLRGFRTDHAALRRLLRAVAAAAASRPARLRNRTFTDRLERTVVKILFERFEASRRAVAPSPSRALACRAEAWLRQNLAEPPTIADLCAALNSSERTVHEAFRMHLGASPKAYLKTLRLNAARRDLMRGRPHTRVTDVALDWGFLHFGWFSQDYRRLFAETPSQTLQRGREDASRRIGSVAGGPVGLGRPGGRDTDFALGA